MKGLDQNSGLQRDTITSEDGGSNRKLSSEGDLKNEDIREKAEREFKVTSVQALYRLPSTHGFLTVDTVSPHFDQ